MWYDRGLRLWDRLTRRWYRPPAYQHHLDWETIRFINQLRGTLPHETALALLETGKLAPQYHYRHFSRAKKDGTRRALVEPDDNLKAIQRALLKYEFKSHTPHYAAVGFRKKKSIADHVWPHVGAEYIITADIQDFFPQTKRWRIADWWAQHYESEQTVTLATMLTTYHGSLPQGAPTSPVLSNLVNSEMDRALARRTEQAYGTYTRYCDDMVFSFYDPPPSDFAHAVRATIYEAGYELHPRKGWQVHHRRDEPEITGVILNRNGKVTVPKAMLKKMRQLERSGAFADQLRLDGYRAYQQMVERR